ncbi:phosphatidate cytidylyltransferase [Candidatus Pelagibacter ubique]|jgi:phosphatidate cytidylyltransferase|uniref:phosphatidate cytidylyltransferase n=1 Tax=Pelagibacter ubique TaxID=198252 RepID=UPI00037ED6E2|nr:MULTISPECIES: phosphatidate cytidylyltransferase [Pelagibacter]MDA7481000.1 phosphatidate cytidylyltransferase [Candidatus Pelagibacter ubique]MDA8835764.1 phosphatidate cytidylyltransferase [Candidatus Pelagibacter bacterium]MDC0372544.1 phosphatidate cytidylyltransferase [Candidatus Pelagibacter ubique]MDC0508404.1 phosphatidate cytidylyltransferase [Candidatus Pelagibacter ubique]MDC0543326.1 phosphatidate cytidylyltransferase [Candidatus Pelagibacter ubique]
MSSNIKKRILTSILLIALLLGMFFYSYIMIISLIIIAIISWIEFYALISKILKKNILKDKFFRFFYKALSLIYLSGLVYLIFAIESEYSNLKIYLLYSVIVAILSDIGGLVCGKIFKGKKLTKISPNKTISGSIGSFMFSTLLIPFFYKGQIDQTLVNLFIITIIISLTSQLGDLFISLLKRKAKVKDTSDLLPGHGGVLDRIDGIIFAIPLGIFLFIII